MMAIDLSKQALQDDLKTMQHTNFTRNLDRNLHGNTAMLFIIEESKEPILDFSEGPVKVL